VATEREQAYIDIIGEEASGTADDQHAAEMKKRSQKRAALRFDDARECY
jgi:hypothetical protein